MPEERSGSHQSVTGDLNPVVGIVLGSDSDRPAMEEATRTLTEFGITPELVVASAHRSPELLDRYARALKPEASERSSARQAESRTRSGLVLPYRFSMASALRL